MPRPITIGSDPEFLLARDGRRVRATNYFRGLSSAIGCDGHDSTGEIRPRATTSPNDHFFLIKSLIRRIQDHLPNNVEVRAGNTGDLHEPIGGHIHFGIEADPFLTKALDMLLSVPVLFIEQPPMVHERRSGSYGKLGAVRNQPWGFEYRTPASWLIEPSITQGILQLSYLITASYQSGVLDTYARRIQKLRRNWSDAKSAYQERNLSFFREKRDKAIRIIEHLPGYAELPAISPLLTRSREESCWDERRNLLLNWNPSLHAAVEQATRHRHPRREMFAFSPDDYLHAIGTEVGEMRTRRLDSPIAVFGLADHRLQVISTNSVQLQAVLERITERPVSLLTVKHCSTPEIGFHYSLRHEHAEEVVEILQALAASIKRGALVNRGGM